MYRKCKRHFSADTTRVQPHIQPQTPWSLLAVPISGPSVLTGGPAPGARFSADPGRVPQSCLEYDFVHDETTDGRRLKGLTVLDEYTREGLAIHYARSITAADVVHVLQGLFVHCGAPGCPS
jgi:hypothetical protein